MKKSLIGFAATLLVLAMLPFSVFAQEDSTSTQPDTQSDVQSDSSLPVTQEDPPVSSTPVTDAETSGVTPFNISSDPSSQPESQPAETGAASSSSTPPRTTTPDGTSPWNGSFGVKLPGGNFTLTTNTALPNEKVLAFNSAAIGKNIQSNQNTVYVEININWKDNGEAYSGPATVSFIYNGLTANDRVRVLHMNADGSVDEVKEAWATANHVNFNATSFSPFAIFIEKVATNSSNSGGGSSSTGGGTVAATNTTATSPKTGACCL